jgi:hypothetical protein
MWGDVENAELRPQNSSSLGSISVEIGKLRESAGGTPGDAGPWQVCWSPPYQELQPPVYLLWELPHPARRC